MTAPDFTIKSDYQGDTGVPASPSGHSPKGGAATASPAKPSVPNADELPQAIRSKYDALVAARKPLAAQLVEIERGINACHTAARLFGVALPGLPRPGGLPPRITVSEIVKSLLVAAGKDGVTATEIRPIVESAYGSEIHPKSVGVALHRLANSGAAKCVARRWFYLPRAS